MAYTTRFVVMQIRLDIIETRPTHRPINNDAVGPLAASMTRLGLREPIYIETKALGEGFGYWVVTGAHRLAAARSLGWETIPCYIDATDARLWEISENLHRAELSVLERAEQIDEWRVLTEVRQVSAKLEETSSKGGRPGAVAETARDLGVSESEARRSVKIASISDDAKDAAKAAGLDDNQSVLLKVAAAPVETQADVVAEIAEARANKAAGKSATVDEVVEAGDDHLTPGLTAVETATFRSLLHKIVVREFTFDYDDDSCAFREPRPDPDGSRARFIESLDTAELEHRVMYGNYDLMQRMFGDFKKTKVEKEFARAAKRAARRAT